MRRPVVLRTEIMSGFVAPCAVLARIFVHYELAYDQGSVWRTERCEGMSDVTPSG